MKCDLWFLIFWVCCALVLCLMPGPGYWDKHLPAEEVEVQVASSATFDAANAQNAAEPSGVLRQLLCEDLKSKEWWGHFLPMLGITVCLVRILRRCKMPVMLACAGVFCMALLIELLQEILPACFSRGFAWADIRVALTAALIGIVATVGGGFVKQRRQARSD